MAEDQAWEARKRRDQVADECAIVFLDGLRAFFSGAATLHVGPMMPGHGMSIRFYKDAPAQTQQSYTAKPSPS